MNNIEELIQKLYDNLVIHIVEGMEEQEKIVAQNEFLRVLKNRYLNLNVTINNYNLLYEKLYKLEYHEWSDLPIGMRKHILLKDVALNQIIDITSAAYRFAKDRLNNNKLISVDTAEEYIGKLEELLNLVKDYNKQLAEWHISEGSIDLKYSSGQTDYMSLRIGHIK